MSRTKQQHIKDTDFLSLSARLHVLETRLLNRDRRERMLEARDDSEALRVLTECGYPEVPMMEQTALEASLGKAQADLYADLQSAMPHEHILTVFQLRDDYHNAKVLVKSQALGTDAQRLLVSGGRYDPQDLAAAFRKEDLSAYSVPFRQAVTAARDLLATSQDPQRVDFLLDRAAYGEMAQEAKQSGSAFLVGYVQITVDALNLRALVRARRNGQSPQLLREALLPGGTVEEDKLVQTRPEELSRLYRGGPLNEAAQLGEALLAGGGDMTAFERACDDAVTRYVQSARRVPFGVEPVVGYLYARQNELTAIRTIFSGRLAGLERDVIRERLRESYG